MVKFNRIYGLNYNVFSHVRVLKKMIPMDVPINTTPNVERETLRARDDGNGIQFKINKGNNMK